MIPTSERLLALRSDCERLWPGLLLATVVAIAAAFIAEHRGGPTLLYALLIGMALNAIVADGRARAGVDFAARHILRIGVALLGARITLAEVLGIGWVDGTLVIAGVIATITFGVVAARFARMSVRFGLLTGGATAICGASAAIAIAAVLPRDENSERELLFTIAGVTILSTAAMVLYPILVAALALDSQQAAVFLGATIHDVAQVVGAGYSISTEVGDAAVVTKLLRVAMLLPVVMAIAIALRRQQSSAVRSTESLVPLFLIGFVALVVAGSIGLIPKVVGATLSEAARVCLVIAIAAVGLKTSPLELKKVGPQALLLLCAETIFLVGFVLLGQFLFHTA